MMHSFLVFGVIAKLGIMATVLVDALNAFYMLLQLHASYFLAGFCFLLLCESVLFK